MDLKKSESQWRGHLAVHNQQGFSNSTLCVRKKEVGVQRQRQRWRLRRGTQIIGTRRKTHSVSNHGVVTLSLTNHHRQANGNGKVTLNSFKDE